MSRDHTITTQNFQQPQYLGNHLFKVIFHDFTVLSALSNTPITVPQNLHLQMLSTLKAIHSYSSLESMPLDTQEVEEKSAIKVGQQFHLQFYFLNKFLYFNKNQEKFVLSSEQKTAFKILAQYKLSGYNDQFWKKQQNFNSFGKISFGQATYHLVTVDEPICLKSNGNCVYPGNYDEKARISLFPSLYSNQPSIYNTPSLFFSLQDQKYVCFDLKNSQMKFTTQKVFLQCICRLQKTSKGVRVRIMQENNQSYLTVRQVTSEVNGEAVSDISKMLKNFTLRQFDADSFSTRKEQSASQKLSIFQGISRIHTSSSPQAFLEAKKGKVAKINFKKYSQKKQASKEQQFVFNIRHFFRNGETNNVFLFKQIQLDSNSVDNIAQCSRCSQYFLDLLLPDNIFILRESNKQGAFSKNNSKSLFRVQPIIRQQLSPYVSFFSLQLKISLWKYYKQLGKSQFDVVQVKSFFKQMLEQYELLQAQHSEQFESILCQLIDLQLLSLLVEAMSAVVHEHKINEIQFNSTWLEKLNQQEDQALQSILKLIVLLIKYAPEKIVSMLLLQKQPILLVKLGAIDLVFRQLIKVTYACSQQSSSQKMVKLIEDKLMVTFKESVFSRAYGLCCLWGNDLLKRTLLKSNVIQNAIQSLLKFQNKRLDQNLLLVIELKVRIKNQGSTIKDFFQLLNLSYLEDQQVLLQLRQNYLSLILSFFRREIRLPLILKEQSNLAFFFQRYKLNKENKTILMTYFEEVLPEKSQVELVQNKIISFGVVQLVLQLQEDFHEFSMDYGQNKSKSFELLIANIEKNIAVYKYQPQFLYKFLKTAIQTLRFIHLRYFQHNVLQVIIQSPHLTQEQIKKKSFELWNSEMNSQSIEQKQNNLSFEKNGIGIDSRKQVLSNKLKQLKDVVLSTKIMDFLFQKPAIDEQTGMDRYYIWDAINGKHSALCSKNRLDIFEQVVQLLNSRYNPSWLSDQCIQISSQTFSEQFIDILAEIIDKAFLNRMPLFIESLNGCQMQGIEWRVLISIINKNKLLPCFLKNQDEKQNETDTINELFTFLLTLFQKYMQFSREDELQSVTSKEIRGNFHYLYLRNISLNHQLQPQNFIKYLKNGEPTYEQKEIQLHFQLVSCLGAITNQQYFHFYMQYIIRYECQNYNKKFLQLALLIFQTLSQAYKQQLSSALSYSFFKQHEVLKKLILDLIQLKYYSTDIQIQQVRSPQKRASIFKFLLYQQKMIEQKYSGDEGQEILCFLFQLFTEVTNHSKNSKNFVSKMGYNVLYAILESSSNKIKLKSSLNLFLFSHIKILFMFIQQNYTEEEKDTMRTTRDNGQWDQLIEWIKRMNNFLYNQIDYFKRLFASSDEIKGHFNYIILVLESLKLREEIADYFMPNRLEKVKYTQSAIGEQSEEQKSLQQSNQNLQVSQSRYFDGEKSQINENELDNISEINQMLAYELVQKLEKILTDQEASPNLGDLLFWLKNYYGISSNKIPTTNIKSNFSIRLVFPFANGQNLQQNKDNNEKLHSKEKYSKINDFLRPRIENYLVLLIELLQRTITVFLSTQNQKTRRYFKESEYLQKVKSCLYLIELCLEDEIIIYQELDKTNEKKLYEVLPFKYKQISDFEQRRVKKKKEGVQSQKCCRLQQNHIQAIFKLLLKCFKHKQYVVADHLHLILEKTVVYNTQNQINLQKIIQKYFKTYFHILHRLIKHFRNTSPLVSYNNFVFYDFFSHQKFHIYGDSLLQTPPSSRIQLLKKYGDIIGGSRGLIHYQNELKYFKNTVNMLLATSKYLNFNFKQILSHSTIDEQSILHELLNLLEQTVNNKMQIVTLHKLQLIECVIKLVISFLRGPIQPNIYICVSKNYYERVLKKLFQINQEQNQDHENTKICLLRIRKIVAQTLFILNPYMPKNQIKVGLIEEDFRKAYSQSRKLYKGNYEDIIIDYNNPEKKFQESLLLFDLALNYFYFLIQFYSITGNNAIKDVQIALLEQHQKSKKHQERWMLLYKLYRLIRDIILVIKDRLFDPYKDGKISQEEGKVFVLHKAIEFFTKHVGNIEVKIEGKIKTISFLLLKETQCRTSSIRNKLHRWVGIDERALRLNNFLAVSKYIILRLQIEASIIRKIENFKLLYLIIKNKDLWKSISFLLVLIINVIYMFVFFFTNNFTFQQLAILIKVFLSFIYVFQAFLLIVYIVQILPLKLKIYKLINQKSFKITSVFIFLQDKTLFTVIAYTTFVSMAFWSLGWISLLTLDYFFSFKTSDSIMKLLFKCLLRILYIIILIGVILFAITVIKLSVQNSNLVNCQSPIACTQQNFSILLGLNLNVFQPVEDLPPQTIVAFFIIFFIQILITNLLVGVIFAEQKIQNDLEEQRKTKTRHNCFICGKSQNVIEKLMKVKQGFYLHLRFEHYLWNYIYYLIYLKNRDKKDLNSIQSLIVEKWNNNEIDWLPDQLTK